MLAPEALLLNPANAGAHPIRSVPLRVQHQLDIGSLHFDMNPNLKDFAFPCDRLQFLDGGRCTGLLGHGKAASGRSWG